MSWFRSGQGQGAAWGLSQTCVFNPARNWKSAPEVSRHCSAPSFTGWWGTAISLLSPKCFATSVCFGFTESAPPSNFGAFWAVVQRRAEGPTVFYFEVYIFHYNFYSDLFKQMPPSSLTDKEQSIIFSYGPWTDFFHEKTSPLISVTFGYILSSLYSS